MRTRLMIVMLSMSVMASAQSPAPQPAQTAQPPAVASVPNCPELATALGRVIANDTRLRDWANMARYREALDALHRSGDGATTRQ